MRVLMSVPSGYGGLFEYSIKLSEGLVRRNCRVTLLTSSDCSRDSKTVEVVRSMMPMLPDRRLLKYKPFWAADRVVRACMNAMRRHKACVKMHPDVVHVQLNIPVVDQIFLPVLTRKFKTVLTVHDVRLHNQKSINNRKNFLKRMYRSAHHLIVHTEINRRQLLSEFTISSDRVSVIPHGASSVKNGGVSRDEARKRLGIRNEIPLVLFSGNLRENKGLGLLLKAMPLVRDGCPGTMLLIAGRMPLGESFDKYEGLIDSLGLRGGVLAKVGWVEESEMNGYFRASDVVAMPYKSFASQSGVLLSAYSFKRPVVVTDVGGLGETVASDRSGMVVGQSAESISAGIIRLLEDETLYEEASANMQKAIETKYDWDIVAGKTKDLYEEIIGR